MYGERARALDHRRHRRLVRRPAGEAGKPALHEAIGQVCADRVDERELPDMAALRHPPQQGRVKRGEHRHEEGRRRDVGLGRLGPPEPGKIAKAGQAALDHRAGGHWRDHLDGRRGAAVACFGGRMPGRRPGGGRGEEGLEYIW